MKNKKRINIILISIDKRIVEYIIVYQEHGK